MRKKRKQRARAEKDAVQAAYEAAEAEGTAVETEVNGADAEHGDELEASGQHGEDALEDKALEDSEEALEDDEEALEASGQLAEDDEDGEELGEGASPLTQEQVTRVVESLLFASDRPLLLDDLHRLLGKRTIPKEQVQTALDELAESYQGRGIVLHSVAGGYQLRTHPESSEWVQKLIAGRPVRLSRAQLETLAIIAYRQPITRPEIDDIRGVDSGGTLRVLLDRSLIRILGKKEEPGRPLLYGTTKDFLEFFNLGDLQELPTLREYSELSEDSIAEVQRLGHSLEEVDDSESSDDGGESGSGSGVGGGSAADATPEEVGDAGAAAVATPDDDVETAAVASEIVAEGSGAFIAVGQANAPVLEEDGDEAASLASETEGAGDEEPEPTVA